MNKFLLKEFRLQRGLSQEHIAKKLYVVRQTISKWENGLSSPSAEQLIETVHPRFAISWRNKWMLKQSDYVVTYITHSWGGAAQFVEMAERQKKHIINLA